VDRRLSMEKKKLSELMQSYEDKNRLVELQV
jgi:hypothetical protein